jgi:hypothetical protein
MGARFAEPSSLSVEMSTTGVPKYRIPGSIVLCGESAVDVMESTISARAAGALAGTGHRVTERLPRRCMR